MPHPSALTLRNLDLNLLKVFDAVMAERSLTRAAHQLALTQPAVSNALRRLREALGDDLLVRQDRTLMPTPRAMELWPTVRSALQQLQTSLTPNVFDPAGASNTFNLTMADATAAELMPALLPTLAAQAPHVSLRLVPLTTRDPRPLLEEGRVDLALGHFPAVMADLNLRAQSGQPVAFLHHQLFEGDYVCVMQRNHPLAQVPLTLDTFCGARHLLVSFPGVAVGLLDDTLAALGRVRRVVLTVNQYFTAARVAAHSDLLAVLPRHCVQISGFAEQLAVLELPFAAPSLRVNALWHQRKEGVSAQAWLRSVIAMLAVQAFPG